MADSDPNVIYVGMGEACVRGNASHGDGVYKSVGRAARPGSNVGLQDSYHIGAVRVHPKNPDIVYVAALGHLWGPNEMRGVYRSTDGGATWKQVFTRGQRRRRGGSRDGSRQSARALRRLLGGQPQALHFDSGGPGSGLFKSTDGGDTWTEISRAPGLPRGVLGRIGVTVSPANPERVWAHRRGGRRRRLPLRQRAAATGPGSTSRASCASAPGITRTSSPTRKTPTRCTR